jgi:hypothetical protein
VLVARYFEMTIRVALDNVGRFLDYVHFVPRSKDERVHFLFGGTHRDAF